MAEIVLAVAREATNKNVPMLFQRALPARVIATIESEEEVVRIKKKKLERNK